MPCLDIPQLPTLPAGGTLPGKYQFNQFEHNYLNQNQCNWCVRLLPLCVQVYFSSLPLGIYLLMIGQLWLGVVLVSLVPSTLLLLVLYGFCQCLCHELMEALAARTHSLP